MPTNRPRHQVTETPDVQRALDLAEREWPDLPRGRLLVRLVTLAGESLAEQRFAQMTSHERLVDETSGKYTDLFPAGYVEELREDWPE